jgi:hypothetical protein
MVKMALHPAFHALILALLFAIARSQSTMVVSVISTTTVHATASGSDACNNFYGACVVYGGQGEAYTTTVYRDTTASPTDVTTSTTVVQTTTVSDAGACSNFAGSCVVYGGENGGAAYTTTAAGYQSGQGNGQRPLGNSDGYIAQDKGGSPAVIGAGYSLAIGKLALMSFVAMVVVAVWL